VLLPIPIGDIGLSSPAYVFASFPDDSSLKTVIESIAFSEKVLRGVKSEVLKQIESVLSCKPVEFDGRYKSEPKEILYIDNYSDPDETFKNIEQALKGFNPGIIENTEKLQEAFGLFFVIEDEPDKIAFQKFSRRMLINKKTSFFKASSSEVYDYLPESSFSLANSISGYYERSSKRLFIRSAFVGRQIFPSFSDEYVPGATVSEIREFLERPQFDISAIQDFNSDSQKLARLVWLIRDSGIKLADRLEDLRDISTALNLKCITEDGHIRLFPDIEKTKLVLQIILKDVYRQGNEIFLSNSKRALTPFKD
jgi:hypothetical protein